jgi:fucose permease
MPEIKIKYRQVLPVLFSFFVMSFVDLVGTGVDEIKEDSDTPAYILQLIPFVAFIWFFILSVPVGILQDKIGKKKILNYGILISAIGLLFPAFGNSLWIILCAFALLGIGNTILQVSANPLLVDVVPLNRKSSFLSLSQFFKSVGSIVGPFVAALAGPWLAGLLGDTSPGAWRYGLYLFAVFSILISLWLSRVDIQESETKEERASLRSSFKLLNNQLVLLMVIGIFIMVGIDVAVNANIGTYLTLKLGMDESLSKYAKSMYFFAKMIGTFAGAILLTRITSKKFYLGSALMLTLATAGLLFIQTEWAAWLLIALLSLGASNIFPLIFSITVGKLPTRGNEISGLMMMAISGGAIMPFLVGIAMEKQELGGILVLLACAVYLLILGIYLHYNDKINT